MEPARELDQPQTANAQGDYVQVSWESGSLALTVPKGVDPRAFLDALPWFLLDQRLHPRPERNPWRRASLYVGGDMISEIFFIADA